jgi:hypothetical protein
MKPKLATFAIALSAGARDEPAWRDLRVTRPHVLAAMSRAAQSLLLPARHLGLKHSAAIGRGSRSKRTYWRADLTPGRMMAVSGKQRWLQP